LHFIVPVGVARKHGLDDDIVEGFRQDDEPGLPPGTKRITSGDARGAVAPTLALSM